MREILKEKTLGLCSICYSEVDAQVYEENGRVYIVKNCPKHGETVGLVEKDAAFYKRVMNKAPLRQYIPREVLVLPVTHACNLNCKMCYLPQRNREDMSLDRIKQAILAFEDEIGLSGGEPTLRKELFEIIRFAKQLGRKTCLITNGVKLADEEYVMKLEEAGLDAVLFSLNGFDDNICEQISAQRGLLAIKLKALEVLSRHKIRVCISPTFLRGINDGELKKIINFCFDNNSFIQEIRIRSLGQVGRYPDREPFVLSEMLDMFAEAIELTREELLHGYPRKDQYHSAYQLRVDCHFYQKGNRRFLQLLDKNVERNWVAGKGKGKLWQFFSRLAKINKSLLPSLLTDKLLGRNNVKTLIVNIYVWPDVTNVDLNEVKVCTVWHLTETHGALPFYLAVIGNKKDVVI